MCFFAKTVASENFCCSENPSEIRKQFANISLLDIANFASLAKCVIFASLAKIFR